MKRRFAVLSLLLGLLVGMFAPQAQADDFPWPPPPCTVINC